MPNWVFNTITIEGDEREIERVKEQLNRPFIRKYEESEWNEATKTWERKVVEAEYKKPVFAFHNIIAPQDMDAYAKQPERGGISLDDPDWYAKSKAFAATQPDWYSFNTTNWGTKWDVACGNDEDDSTLTAEFPNALHYRFDTAWSPPVPALEELSRQYPTLIITDEWEEEQGFGSTITCFNGETTETEEFNSICHDCDKKLVEDNIWREEADRNLCQKCFTKWKVSNKVSQTEGASK